MTEEGVPKATADDAPIGFDVLRTAVALLPPVALITGVLFYFGWVRVASVARALGQSDSVYGYTTTDYVLRSVGSLFFPLLVLTASALLVLIAHQQVQRALREGNAGWAPAVARGLIVLGVALLCYGVLYALRLFEVQNAFMDVTGPLALGMGALLIAYGGWLRSQVKRGPGAVLPTWQRAFAAGMLMSIAALSLFWGVGNYAQVRGVQDARLIEASYRTLPAVVVHSAKDLGLEPDAAVHPSTSGDARYEYTYTCLRLLDHVDGTWYLLPENWAFNRRLIMLDEDPDTRFELTGAPEALPCPGTE